MRIFIGMKGNGQYTNTSVRWGDENQYGAYPQANYISGTQSFTHTYAQRGVYTITFTAGNQYSQSNTATMTVYVY